MLRSSVRAWLGSEPTLAEAGQMGLLGLLTPERSGGSGWLPAEACVVAREAGRALCPLPWTGNLLAAAALSADSRHAGISSELLAGTAEAAVTHRGLGALSKGGGILAGRVEVTAAAPAVLVLLDPSTTGIVMLDCRSDEVGFEASDSMDSLRPTGTLVIRAADAQGVDGADVSLLADAATLIACADSLGALSSAADRVRSHLSERLAFERPLASFQELQHRLADLAVLEAACEALIRRTVRALDPHADASARRNAVRATHSFFARRVTAALDDCIQLAGGIGFTWEFPIHHAMRRSAANTVAVRDHRSSLGALDVEALADPGGGTEEGFRRRARAVIREHMPFAMREGHRAPESKEQEGGLRRWYRTLFDNGLLGASWPTEWGGDPEHQPLHDLIVTEELIRARSPRPIDQVQLAAHVLLRFGTDRQKARYLPRIRSADDIWCQLFSEPDAGSDLAGIKARAEQHDDGTWRLAGQKTWTTDGHWAQMGVALLRTSTGARRHHGLTAFVVPMDTPGIEVRPKMTIGGAYEFNDVFLDGAVLGPEHVLGTVGEGWAVAMSGLEIERFGVGGNVLLLDLLLADLSDVARQLPVDGQTAYDHADIHHAIAALASDAYAARSFVADHVEQALGGTDMPGDAAVAKLLYTETYNRIARYGTELVAEHGPVPGAVRAQSSRLMDAWLWSRALTISGGSSEVMRNIIAKRRLGLPQ